LALPLGYHPVFDAQPPAAARVRPTRHIARGVDARRAGLEILVDADAAIDGEARLFGELEARPHADADQHEVRLEPCALFELHGPRIDAADVMAEMEVDTMRLVQGANEVAQHRSQRTGEGPVLGRDHVDLHAAPAKRGRPLEPDEAGADDHHPTARFEAADDAATISERAVRSHMWQICSGNPQPHRLRTRR